MIWRSESIADWKARLAEWHSVFAWFPVFCENDKATAWLCRVERRMVDYASVADVATWEHRLLRSPPSEVHSDG